VDTAGEGYFVGISLYLALSGAGVATNGTTETRVFQFVLPFRAVVRNITTEVTTGGASGKKYGVGLYDIGGNRLLHTGALDAEAVARNVTSITAVTLEPGVYYQAQTTDDSNTQFRRLMTELGGIILLKDTGALVGLAANTSSAGVLPATLGTVTANSDRLPIYSIFSP
jgi:hypothetical protein